MRNPENTSVDGTNFQIEQAIFTSATSAKSEGYHLVAASPGVSEADRRELSIWGPSHDSLLETGHGALSVNFHPLPSGCFCISQTTLEGAEYSGRGPQVYTHSFVVPQMALERFANNPFLFLREATAAGHVRIYSEPPERLKAFSLQGNFPNVDTELLEQLNDGLGARRLALFVDAVLNARCLGVVSHDAGPRLISGLINCLPLEIRPQISLSTALKHSPRRPFRVICVSSKEKEQRRLARQYEIELFHVERKPKNSPAHLWAKYLLQRFEERKFQQVCQELETARPQLTMDNLHELAGELRDTAAFDRPNKQDSNGDLKSSDTIPEGSASTEPQREETVLEILPDFPIETDTPPAEPSEACKEPCLIPSNADHEIQIIPAQTHNLLNLTSDPGDDMSQQTSNNQPSNEEPVFLGGDTFSPTSPRRDPKPAFQLSRQCPEAAARLMRLEATIFESMAGDETAKKLLGPLWVEVREKLGPELHEKCREEFLYYAVHMWQHFSSDVDRNPLQAAAALDVICRLFDEESAAPQAVPTPV
ncbi:MAG: hypothetical protein MPJ50_14610 [Pirellulales bacterium]|nr:hypothetical protein [Pirellulales bacterium]